MSEETREYIIGKAQSLFYRYGIRSITMDFIASELSMSKRTLYENFKNKEELIVECMQRDREAQEQEMCQIFGSKRNIIEKLILCYSRIIYNINRTSRSFQLDVEHMRSKVSEEADKHREKQLSYIRDILQKGVEEGRIRTELNLDIATALHNEQIIMLFRKIKNTPNEEWNYGEVLSVYTKIFLYGIVT
ncbi:MAG: TetR/AcrR family transcriptional regulator, partial [Bacteroidales bacterium]|nr:TetR/AcrR family transcriptional regulator [Bacteroidales bacterium]